MRHLSNWYVEKPLSLMEPKYKVRFSLRLSTLFTGTNALDPWVNCGSSPSSTACSQMIQKLLLATVSHRSILSSALETSGPVHWPDAGLVLALLHPALLPGPVCLQPGWGGLLLSHVCSFPISLPRSQL